MSIFHSFPGAECGFSFLGKTAGRVPGKTAVRDGTAANDGYFARKISRGSGGGARRRKTGQTGGFLRRKCGKEGENGPAGRINFHGGSVGRGSGKKQRTKE